MDEDWLNAFRRNFDLETTVKAIYNAKVEFSGAGSVQIQDLPKQLTTSSKVASNLVKAHSTTGKQPGSAGPHSTQQGSSGSSKDRLVEWLPFETEPMASSSTGAASSSSSRARGERIPTKPRFDFEDPH